MQPQRPNPSRPDEAAESATHASGVDLDALRALIEPELIDVEWTSNHGGLVLRVFIDRPEAASSSEASSAPAAVDAPPQESVTLQDCVLVSRDLSTALDVQDPLTQRYSLEVSSPGLDRPLKTARDYRRQLGRLAKVKLHEPAPDGQMVLRGTILSAADGSVEMDVDGNRHRFSLDNVREARLVFELGSGSGRKKSKQDSNRGSKRRTGARKAGR
jgi:ribosome maturation factor RimP